MRKEYLLRILLQASPKQGICQKKSLKNVFNLSGRKFQWYTDLGTLLVDVSSESGAELFTGAINVPPQTELFDI